MPVKGGADVPGGGKGAEIGYHARSRADGMLTELRRPREVRIPPKISYRHRAHGLRRCTVKRMTAKMMVAEGVIAGVPVKPPCRTQTFSQPWHRSRLFL